MPKKEVTSKVWLGVGDPAFVFPELRNDEDGVAALKVKPDFSISLSGGGFRATACSLGWIQALHTMDILPQARYLCSNSGGSWFNVAFSFQSESSNEHFLGSYCHPSELNKSKLLDHPKGSYARTVDEAEFKNELYGNLCVDCLCLDWLSPRDRVRVRAWSRAVGKCFLRPHGLDNSKGTYALSGLSAQRAKENATAKRIVLAMRANEMPFPICCGTVMPKYDHRLYISFEMTPMYCGVPSRIEDSTQVKLGGVLVEPFAMASFAPEDTAGLRNIGFEAKRVKLKPQWPFSLVQTAGISSQYIAQSIANNRNEAHWELQGCPEIPIWNGIDFKSEAEMPFADGGGTDNLAVFPALRRGVARMLICVAIASPPPREREKWASDAWDISCLFGRVPSGSGPESESGRVDTRVYNECEQVFESREYDDLHTTLMSKLEQGRALTWAKTLKVLPNKTQGVAGNYKVHTVWIFNGGARFWTKQLPEESQGLVKDINDFPYIPTDKLSYKPEETGGLANLSAFNIFESETEIRNMLNAAPAGHHHDHHRHDRGVGKFQAVDDTMGKIINGAEKMVTGVTGKSGALFSKLDNVAGDAINRSMGPFGKLDDMANDIINRNGPLDKLDDTANDLVNRSGGPTSSLGSGKATSSHGTKGSHRPAKRNKGTTESSSTKRSGDSRSTT